MRGQHIFVLWNPLSFFPFFVDTIEKKMDALTCSSLSTSYIIHLLWRVCFIKWEWLFSVLAVLGFRGCSPDVWCSLRAYVWTAGGRGNPGQRGCAWTLSHSSHYLRKPSFCLNMLWIDVSIWSLVLKPWGDCIMELKMGNKNAWKCRQAFTKPHIITFHETEGAFIFAVFQVILVS